MTTQPINTFATDAPLKWLTGCYVAVCYLDQYGPIEPELRGDARQALKDVRTFLEEVCCEAEEQLRTAHARQSPESHSSVIQGFRN